MGRLLLALLVGIVGALIVHIGVIFAMPRLSEDNAWARLTAIMPSFQPTLVAGDGPSLRVEPGVAERFGFMDPAFVTAACRFSVGQAPVRLSAERADAFWSASIVARSGDNLYSINERLAPEARLDLLVGTADQLDEARLAGLLGEEDSIPVVVGQSELYLTFRALVEAESLRPSVEGLVNSLACAPLPLPTDAAAAEPDASDG